MSDNDNLDEYVAAQERARAQRQAEMQALMQMRSQMEQKQHVPLSRPTSAAQTPAAPVDVHTQQPPARPQPPPATVVAPIQTPQRVATATQPVSNPTSHPSQSRPSHRAAASASEAVPSTTSAAAAAPSRPLQSRPQSRRHTVEREVEEDSSPPNVPSSASEFQTQPKVVAAPARRPTHLLNDVPSAATSAQPISRGGSKSAASPISKSAANGAHSAEVSVQRSLPQAAAVPQSSPPVQPPSAQAMRSTRDELSRAAASTAASSPLASVHSSPLQSRPASSASVLSTGAVPSQIPKSRATWTKDPKSVPVPGSAAATTNVSLGPSGRATVSGHFKQDSVPAAKHAPKLSSAGSTTATAAATASATVRAKSAAALARPKGASLAVGPASSSNAPIPLDDMTPEQRAAYALRVQFLGTKVYVEPGKNDAASTAGKPRKGSGSGPGEKLAATTAAAASSPPSSSTVTVAPVRPDSRFLAPTVSYLSSVTPSSPSVEELVSQEEAARRMRELKAKAQRERMERAKRDLAKYKQELAEREAKEAEEAARAEAERAAAEQKRLAAEKQRREAEKTKLAQFQAEKQARELTRLQLETKRREEEALERKRSVEAYLRTKAEQEAAVREYEQQRLRELEQRIQELAKENGTVPDQQETTSAPIAAPTAKRAQPFPVSAAVTAKKLPLRSSPSGAAPNVAAGSAAMARSPADRSRKIVSNPTASILSPPRSTALHPSSSSSPSSLLSDSISFFSSTTDVTQAFIAAQRAKEAAVGKVPSPGGYAVLHSPTNVKKKKRSLPATRASPSTTVESVPESTHPAAPLHSMEAEVEAEFALYDPNHFVAEEEIPYSEDDLGI